MEVSSATLVSNITRTLNLHPEDPVSCQVRAALRQFQQTTSLKFVVPLTALQAAHKSLETFMQRCLHELSSQTECQALTGELSQKLTNKALQVQELVLAKVEVFQRVILGLMTQQPIESNFFPGILEGLVGRLGLAPPGITDPPTSIREGVSCQWAAALRGATGRTEG